MAVAEALPKEDHAAATTRGFRKNFKWMLVGNTLYAVLQWAMLASLSKILNSTAVGEFGIAVALTTPVIFLINLNLRSALATDVGREYTFRNYVTLRLYAIAIGMLLVAIASLNHSYSQEQYVVIGAMAVSKAFDSISDILYGALQRASVMQTIAISRILQGVFQFLTLAILCKITKSIQIAMLGTMTVSALVTLLYDVPRTHSVVSKEEDYEADVASGRPRLTAAVATRLVKLTLPLGAIYCLDQLIIVVPRFALDRYSGASAVGYFTALSYLIVAGSMVINALTEASRTRLAYAFVARSPSYATLTRKLVLIGSGIGALGLVIALLGGKFLLGILYRKSYGDYSSTLCALMVASTFWYGAVFLSAAATSARRFLAQVPILAISCATVICFSYLLVPRYGPLGAAEALIVGMAVRYVTALGLVISLCKNLTPNNPEPKAEIAAT